MLYLLNSHAIHYYIKSINMDDLYGFYKMKYLRSSWQNELKRWFGLYYTKFVCPLQLTSLYKFRYIFYKIISILELWKWNVCLPTISGWRRIWLGASDVAEEGRWEWLSGRCSIDAYDNWFPSQPDAHQNQHCMTMGPWNAAQDDFFEWVDEPCGYSLKFICEFIWHSWFKNSPIHAHSALVW